MGITSCTINGVSYPVKAGGAFAQGFFYDDIVEVPGQLTVTIEDSSGTANFTRGELVQLIDSIDGVKYSGYVLSSRPTKLSPATSSTAIEHTVTCTDKNYPLTKLVNTTNYQNWYAGDIATDMVVNGSLAGEGITVAANLHHDSTDANFNTGILSGTVGDLNDTGDGCLELAPAGSDVSFSEKTTADFATGTLTNCTAANNQLSPNTQNALKFSAFLPISSDQSVSSFLTAKFWSGSMTIGTSDTLNFDVWIADTSPQSVGSVTLLLSDLTTTDGRGLYDQNGLLIDENTDLSSYASNTWYTRQVALTGLNGKTVIAVMASSGGNSVGTYTWYIRNCYLGSQTGNRFFSTTSTVPQLNPPTVYQYQKYIGSRLTATVVTTFDPNNSYRISPSHSISAVGLIKNTNILWAASASVLLYVTYNGGSSWIPCTNNAALPGMPVGSTVAGLSLQLKEVFGAGDDPTVIPVLDSVAVSLLSAPNATKSDIVTSFLTQANWNTGTHSATTATSGGILELASYTRDWSDHTTTGQTPFLPTSPAATTESASSGSYVMTCPVNNGTGADGWGISRLDFLGTMLNFTIDCDIKTSNTNMEVGITYRQIRWANDTNNTFGYFVGAYGSPGVTLEMGYGSNSTNDAFTKLASASVTVNTNTTYHIKIVVNGSHHQVYWNNATTPAMDIIDTTYTQAGGIGLRGYNNVNATGSNTATWDNLVFVQQPAGTWTSGSTSVSSLTTCGGSVITWQESGTSNPALAYAFVQSSIDGGSTYQACTNGGVIPGLTDGVSLASKSVKIQALLGTQTNTVPMVSGLVWRVLGQYPGSSGTRSTKPEGIDYVDRANAGVWGTASDGQAWVPVGTGTKALTANTLTIANTTGDVHEVLGSRTWTDEEGTVRFQLSASTITGGIELRYLDTNNFYRLASTTTALSIQQKRAGSLTTVATTAVTLSTGTWYWLRFRVASNGPVLLYGRVWASGVLEPTTWNVTGSV